MKQTALPSRDSRGFPDCLNDSRSCAVPTNMTATHTRISAHDVLGAPPDAPATFGAAILRASTSLPCAESLGPSRSQYRTISIGWSQPGSPGAVAAQACRADSTVITPFGVLTRVVVP